MNKQKLNTFIGYSNADNPAWFKRMCRNLFKIKHYQWHASQSWGGLIWQRTQLKRVIKKLKADNQRILKREFPAEQFPKEHYHFVFDCWKDHQHKNIPVLEVWQR